MTHLPASSALHLLVIGNGPTGVGSDGRFHVDNACGQFLLDLAAGGYDVAFAQPAEPLDLELNYYGCVLPSAKVRTIALDTRRVLGLVRSAAILLWALLGADFVYLFYPGRLPRFVARLCSTLRKPYGVYLRGAQFDERGIDCRTFRRAAFILVVSSRLAERVCQIASRVETIRPMCDISAADATRRSFARLPPNNLRILFVGRIEAEKGIPELVEAARLLHRRGLKFELTLVGLGDLHAELALQRAAGLLPGIRVLGAIEDRAFLMRLYEQSDIFVLPSHHEGFPRVLFEAMIKSAVVVTTLVGGIAWLMKDQENCLAVPVGDAEAIAAAIETLHADPALMQRLSTAALDTAIEILESNVPHAEMVQRRLTSMFCTDARVRAPRPVGRHL